MKELRQARALVRRLWLIALLTLVGAGSAAYVGSLRPPRYEATVTLAINPAAPSPLVPYLNQAAAPGSAVAIPNLVASYTEYLRSNTFTTLAVERLGAPGSPKQLARAIRTSFAPNTNIFRLSVTWDSPAEAARIANGVATLFITEHGAAAQVPKDQSGSVDYYRMRVDQLRTRWDELQASTTLPPAEKAAALEQTGRLLASMEESYARWSQTASLSQAARQPTVDSATILDAATVPTSPIGASLLQRILFGSSAGLALGIGLAALLEYLDDSVKSGREASRLARLPLLGSIAQLSKDDLGPNHLLDLNTGQSPAADAYRIIRTNIQFAAVGQPCKTLLVTSPAKGEGKSTTAANLAVVMARAGKRVVLVDADFRAPSVHKLFTMSGAKSPGLSSCLTGTMADPASLLHETAVENLRVLLAGPSPSHPTELLQTPRFKDALRRLTEIADLVILDSPPVLPVADAAALAELVDGVILVVAAGETRPAAIERTRDTLDRSAASIFGVVINKLTRWHDDAYGYGYQYHREPYGSAVVEHVTNNASRPVSVPTGTRG